MSTLTEEVTSVIVTVDVDLDNTLKCHNPRFSCPNEVQWLLIPECGCQFPTCTPCEEHEDRECAKFGVNIFWQHSCVKCGTDIDITKNQWEKI